MHANGFRLFAYLCFLSVSALAQSIISTLVGTDWVFNGDGLSAIDAPLGEMKGVAPGPDGSYYFLDRGNRMVMQVDAQGILHVVAGNGLAGASVVSAPSAKNVALSGLVGIIGDGAGGLYISNWEAVLRIDAFGSVTTIAGGGTVFPGDTGPARSARMNPNGIALDKSGNLFIADSSNHRVRKVTPDGIITTFAGTGVEAINGDGGPASQAGVAWPTALTFDADGSLFIAEGNTLRKISPSGIISTVISRVNYINALLFDSSGVLVLGTSGGLYRVNAAGIAIPFGGHDYLIQGATAGPDGSIVFCDVRENKLLKMLPSGQVITLAGNNKFRAAPDGTPAISSYLNNPAGLAINPQGELIIADTDSYRALRIGPDGRASTAIQLGLFYRPNSIVLDSAGGIWVSSFRGIFYTPRGGVPRIVTSFGGPRTPELKTAGGGLALDAANNLYISDHAGHRIFKLPQEGIARLIAGTGLPGTAGDGGLAVNAQLNIPQGLAFDPSGNLYVAESGSNRVRRITPDGVISTVAGTGVAGFSGDLGLPSAARLSFPGWLAFDAIGRLLVSDSGNYRIRRITLGQSIETIAGNGKRGFSGDGGLAIAASLSNVGGITTDSAGNILLADTNNDRVRVIQSTPAFDLTPTRVSFAAPDSPSAEVRLSSTVSGLAFTATVDAGAANWLSVSPSSGTLPASLQVSANAANLAPGQYTGAISVSVPLATPALRLINVTFTVPAAQAPKLNIGGQSVSFRFQLGDGSSSLGLSLSNQGGGTLNFTATSSGGDWLTVSPAKGQLAAGANTTLNLTATPTGLAEGTYSTSLQISDGTKTTMIPVTLSIARAQAKLLVSQTGLAFTAVSGGGSPSSQTFGVLNEGSGELPFQTQVTTLSGGNWLKVNNGTGRIIRPLQDVSFVEVVPDTRNLLEGDYYAEIRVTAPGAVPQIVTALVKVLPKGSNPGPEVRPTGLVFIGPPGAAPPSEDVRVSNLVSNATTYTSSSLTFDGGKWISHFPAAATIAPNEPRRIVVQSDFTGITAGVKRGALYLLFEDGTSRTVNILSIVPATAPKANGKNGERDATSCSSPTLRSEFLTLSEGSAITVGQPVSIEVKVADECGNFLLGSEKNTNSAVYAKFSNGDSDLRLVPVGNGVWSGTWRPINAPNGSVTVSAVSVFVQGLTLQAGRSDRTIRLSPASNAPIVRQESFVHSASQRGDVPVAPGTLVTIYGSNLAGSSRATAIPFPVEVDGTQVLLGGQPLPILYSSASQINAQVPYDLPVNTQHQVVVRRGTTLSVPESFTVASSQPGIFTTNQQGTGQGIVMGPDQITVADQNKPAQRGQAIVIYCTGLGAVTPVSILGQPAPSSPLATAVSPVQVTVGEKLVQVFFSGLTPGFTGLYQVNAILALDTPTGDAVPLTISTAGQISNVVSIAVR